MEMTGPKAGTDKETFAIVMDILFDISNRLKATEQGTEELRPTKAEAPERAQRMSSTQPTAWASRGRSHHRANHYPTTHHPASPTLADLAE